MAGKDQQVVGTIKPSDPSPYPEAVTNDVDLVNIARGLYIGVAGDVSVQTVGGVAVLFKNALAGSVIPVRCTKVNASGTTATNIVALG